MYLYHYAMKKIPFGHTPDTELFCQTQTHIEALNVLLFSINSGEAFCKIIGEVGCGKTMLCRVLIRQLESKRKLAYIPNPNLDANALRYTLAKELGLRIKKDCREDQLTQSIQNRLIKLNKSHGPVVLIIDEAQAMSDEALETLRLFTNIETEQQKLLQIVLFAQPELNKKLKQTNLRQLNQRITFSYQLRKLTTQQVLSYIHHRLNVVSLKQRVKVSLVEAILIRFFSRGTPRIINTICHKALLLGFAKKQFSLSLINIIKASYDTDGVDSFILKHVKTIITLALLGVSTTALAFLGGV
ncbi:MAG: AAA family ATPase [Kangiellaceae bacterium]|nr:AAA family ATPase [Kangiellaceae bacterium]